MYRKLSSKLLDLIVTPHVLGEVPTEPTATDADPAASGHPKKIVCYVLQNHSRSNALLVDGETRRLKACSCTTIPWSWGRIKKKHRSCFYSITMKRI